MHNCVAIKESNGYHIRDLDTGCTIGYITIENLVSLVPTNDGFFGTDDKGVGYVFSKDGCLIRNEY